MLLADAGSAEGGAPCRAALAASHGAGLLVQGLEVIWGRRGANWYLVLTLRACHSPVMENKEIVRRYWEGRFNEKNYGVVDEFLSAESYEHDQMKAWLDDCHEVFPDLRLTIENLIAEGDLVVVHFTFEATRTREWAGLPPSQERETSSGLALCRLANGKVVEDDVVFSDEHRKFLMARAG
jgi:predicted ester cyclase